MPDVDKLSPENKAKLLGCVKGKNDAWKQKNNATEVPEDVNKRHFSECAKELNLEYEKEELVTETLTGVPIFKAGAWTDSQGRKKKFTNGDLDQMVANFRALGDKVKPFLKLMHLTPAQHRKVTAAPALGWMSALRRSGATLVADFTDVPRKVAALIRARTYKRVSAEIFKTFRDESTNRVYSNVVSAVGLLGATHPAVNTLDDVLKLFGIEDAEMADVNYSTATDWDDCYQSVTTTTGGSWPIPAMAFYEAEHTNIELEDKMSDDKLVERLEKLEAARESEKTEFTSKLDEKDKLIEKLEANNKTKDAEIDKHLESEFQADLDAVIMTAKKDGKISPAQVRGVKTMVEGWRAQADELGKFSIEISDEKTAEGTVIDCFKSYVAELPKHFSVDSERGDHKRKHDGYKIPKDVEQYIQGNPSVVGIASVELNKEVRAYMRENKGMNYIEAFEEVTGEEMPPEPNINSYSREIIDAD